MKKEQIAKIAKMSEETVNLMKEFLNEFQTEERPRESAILTADINRLRRINSSLIDMHTREVKNYNPTGDDKQTGTTDNKSQK